MDTSKTPVERIADMIDDVGLSITMTSLTSTMAFGLGCLSTIPAIFWLCLYGFPTVIIVYLYQITFFVACMVLDERRIEANKRDCCCCLPPRRVDNDTSTNPASEQRGHVVDHLMERFAHILLKPYVKGVIALLFLVLAGGLGYSAAQLEQYESTECYRMNCCFALISYSLFSLAGASILKICYLTTHT